MKREAKLQAITTCEVMYNQEYKKVIKLNNWKDRESSCLMYLSNNFIKISNESIQYTMYKLKL